MDIEPEQSRLKARLFGFNQEITTYEKILVIEILRDNHLLP